jgi:hypothetical protein
MAVANVITDTQNEITMVLVIQSPNRVCQNRNSKFFNVGGRWNQNGTTSIR